MKIPLKNIKREIVAYAEIDDEDFDLISNYSWHMMKGYVVASVYLNKKRKNVYLHRIINNTPDGLETDHIDRDKLNNKKENLRTATRKENVINCNRKRKAKFRGTCFIQKRNKWIASIRVDGVVKYLGIFDNELIAANTYNINATKYHGEFAILNVIDQEELTKLTNGD